MPTTNLSQPIAALQTEAAQLQYIIDFEADYLAPNKLDRLQKRVAYLCKLIAKAERESYSDTIQ